MNNLLPVLLQSLNETLTAAIVVVSASMLLYNLTRNRRNRVARTSGAVLACVTIVYIGDVLVALQPGPRTLDSVLRFQWIGIALMPAAMFHLSDALLATTGLPSRGRRRRIARLLYLLSALFILLAAFSNVLIHPIIRPQIAIVQAGAVFPIYLTFFIIATGVAIVNVQRARKRCLTRSTRRRMGYLQFALITPALGIFPYSVLIGLGETDTVPMLFLVNLTNLVIILMLLFLSYPLSFFGTQVPDRVVKAELLRFMLRGPATALLALTVIIFMTPAVRIMGLTGDSLMPFAVVAVVLVWQWMVALIIPWLEKHLIYSDEDGDQLGKLQNLSERLLTQVDLQQLLDAILAAICDYVQVNTSFVAELDENGLEVISAHGPTRPNAAWLEEERSTLLALLQSENGFDDIPLQKWHSYWITPLYSKRSINETNDTMLIGFIGIQARSTEINLSHDERLMFRSLAHRTAETLDDMQLQAEIYAALEGLLPQIHVTRTRAADVEYRHGREPQPLAENGSFDREQFIEQVRAALRHYWGGPGLTSSRLLELSIVQEALSENGNNPARALRTILQKAI
ncbi:MAG TPA: histidine kinase N-terminal 7TM domain-containing protein, partial [Phototrophicaceae bacterium]|nr:histidine kinase N-terminal 7TM domain-containing protein [Phototrophicaceae bacterium]